MNFKKTVTLTKNTTSRSYIDYQQIQKHTETSCKDQKEYVIQVPNMNMRKKIKETLSQHIHTKHTGSKMHANIYLTTGGEAE